ncbi:MAG: exodeoxyribonuclease VII large subunit [Alphaproteobacteria bacterium]|nr:exodeoxyribonuclease VII large subunit [Alphaproteobacteria bacterium]
MDLTNHPPLYQVSEFSNALKQHVEKEFNYVRIRGEISGLTRAASGHIYYSLKDDKAVINAICWRGVANKLAHLLEEGAEVIAFGKITTYGARSNYQIIVDNLEIAGEGALLKMLHERRKKLAAQGLFNRIPRPLPLVPQHIGVVTSKSGAVLQDILHRIEQRMPCHVMLYAVPVQGKGAENKIAQAIDALQNMSPRPDVIIVARGGGSLEDLWCFNEEIIVQAVARSNIPIISAIGHETDHSLIDEAADYRSPTPTAAAEMATPVKQDLLINLKDIGNRLHRALHHLQQNAKQQLAINEKFLTRKHKIFETYAQHIDVATIKINHAIKHLTIHCQHRLQTIRLPDCRHLLYQKQQIYMGQKKNIAQSYQHYIQKMQKNLSLQMVKLESYSYRKTLQRGFSLVKNEAGELVKHSDTLKTGDKIGIVFANGTADAIIDKS